MAHPQTIRFGVVMSVCLLTGQPQALAAGPSSGLLGYYTFDGQNVETARETAIKAPHVVR
jgi:hypothetical protein